MKHFDNNGITMSEWRDDEEKIMNVLSCFDIDGFTTIQQIMYQTGMTHQEARTTLQKMMNKNYITYYTIDDLKGQGLSKVELKDINEVLNRLSIQKTQTLVYSILRYDKV